MKTIFYIFLTLVIMSCQLNKGASTNTFLLFLPDTTKAYGKDINTWRKTACEKFKLPLLDSGVDSLELRLWISIDNINPQTVWVLRYTDSTWNLFSVYLYNGLIEDSSQHWVIDKPIITLKHTPYDISNFVDSLEKMDVKSLSMNDEDGIKYLNTSQADTCYTVELATKGYYKLLRYTLAKSTSTESNYKKVTQLISFLTRRL